jgi:hypothetical protein
MGHIRTKPGLWPGKNPSPKALFTREEAFAPVRQGFLAPGSQPLLRPPFLGWPGEEGWPVTVAETAQDFNLIPYYPFGPGAGPEGTLLVCVSRQNI